MLPTKSGHQKMHHPYDDNIEPGTFWRLAVTDTYLNEMPAPDHGLILMISEVHIIDDEKHTIVLDPHPLWGNTRPSGPTKFLYDDFLSKFVFETNGEALREIEIATIMNNVQKISEEMKTPPHPSQLIKQHSSPKSTTEQGSSNPTNLANSLVPASLLPTQDVIDAQHKIEARISVLEAQKNWITAKTELLQGQMSLIAAYQTEKVNMTLASISHETNKAQNLLRGVQTMRLFLGEDVEVTEILQGQGAHPNEPLTFMQRMLYLDEEILINNLLEGFSDDQMNLTDLRAIFSENFSLIERMLPFERCAAIVRVRRNSRPFPIGKLDILELFEHIAISHADMKIHIFIRDGKRLSIITADETTSGAERFFPSKAEIDQLFTIRGRMEREPRQISPKDIEYSSARAHHDTVALFYKRFLVLLWGVHERTNVFGSFIPKGTNWLVETTHTNHFRFIHDEENALSDNMPYIDEFFKTANDKITTGSRIIAYWDKLVDIDNAPALARSNTNYDRQWIFDVSPREDINVCIVEGSADSLYIKCPSSRPSRTSHDQYRYFDAKVVITDERSQTHIDDQNPFQMTTIREGVFNLDCLSLETIDHYINSRRARVQYLKYAHILMKARDLIIADQNKSRDLFENNSSSNKRHLTFEQFFEGLMLWRSGNNWDWPQKPTQISLIFALAANLSDPDFITPFVEDCQHVIRAGLKSNGQIFVITNTNRNVIPDLEPTPWLNYTTFANNKKRRIHKTQPYLLNHPSSNERILYEDADLKQKFIDAVAPKRNLTDSRLYNAHLTIKNIPIFSRGICDPKCLEIIRNIQASSVSDQILSILEGTNESLLIDLAKTLYDNLVTKSGRIHRPRIRTSLCLLEAQDEHNISRHFLVNLDIEPDAILVHKKEGRSIIEALIHQAHYAHPERFLSRLEETRCPFTIELVDLTKHQLPSTSSINFVATHKDIVSKLSKQEETSLITDLSWKQAVATHLSHPDISEKDKVFHSVRKRFSTNHLQQYADRIKIIGKKEADSVLSRIWQLQHPPKNDG